MVRRYFLLLVLFFISGLVFSQPDTEVYLLDLTFADGTYTVSNPISISKGNPGYDNQPSFSSDGQYIYYAATRDGQTDILSVNLTTNERKWLSNTSEGGEYSPQLSPDQKYVTAVQLENNGTQLLWKYPIANEKSEVLIEEAKIGYYVWANDQKIVAFVLGEPHTLQIFDISEKSSIKVTENIGRSIHRIPSSSKVSFISKKEKEWMIMSLNPKNGKTKIITCSLTGAEDMTWTPDKKILMGKENKLFFKNPKKDKKWMEIESFNQLGYTGISRVVVSPDGKKLAVVVSGK